MHELTRLAYLEAMGVDNYVSRGPLPGAAPSRRLCVQVRRTETVSPPAVAASPEKPRAVMPALPKPGRKNRKAAEQPATVPVVATPDAPASFSLAAVVAGGRLWLEELDQGTLAREQVKLIAAIAAALGWQGATDHAQFNWPMHNNRQLDLSHEAALAALSGFLERRAQQHPCTAVVMLGQAVQQRLEKLELPLPLLVCEVGSADMLRDPGLKKRAWLSLAGYADRR